MNAAEAINAAGGEIVKADGKTPNVNTPQAAKGLDFLVNGFKQGYIPKEALGFQETAEPERLPGRPAGLHAQLAVRGRRSWPARARR